MDSTSESLIGFLVSASPYVLGVLAVVAFVAILDGRRDRNKPPDRD